MAKLLKFALSYFQSLLGCLYLMLGGFFSKKHRTLLYDIRNHFFEQPESLVPVVELGEIVGDEIVVQLTAIEHVMGNVSISELTIIAALVRKHNPGLSFEIGTFDGRTTLNIAINLKADGKVYTLDLPFEKINSTKLALESTDFPMIDKPASGSRFRGHPASNRIVQLYADSADYDFSNFYGQVDLVFIDGSHSYEYVMSDSVNALRMLRPNAGVIIWHDYGVFPGVTRGINNLFMRHPEFCGLRHIQDTTLCILAKTADDK